MNIAPLRAASSTGLVLIALSAFSPPAGAATPTAGAWPVPGLGSPATVRADAGGTSGASASDVQCPCNAGLPVGRVASVLSSECPCNAGLPDAPSAVLATPALRATHGDAVRSGGGQLADRIGVVPGPASQPSGTFDWADASVGAGFTVVIGLLVAGGALVFSRRRVREQLRAS